MTGRAAIGEGTVRLTGESAELEHAFRQSEARIQAFGRSAERQLQPFHAAMQRGDEIARGYAARLGPLGGALSGLGRGGLLAAAGLGAVAVGMSAAIREASRLEVGMASLDAVLRATQGRVGLTAEEIDALARDIGRSTLASTSEVRQAAAQLLTFQSVAGDTFEETLRLSQDLAALGFGSISSSARVLARALEDPAGGLEGLRRVGVVFTAAQRDMIRAMVDGGDQAEAQALILSELQGRIGGAGTAQAGGLAGAVDTLGENWTELLETMGTGGSLNIAADATNLLAASVRAVNDAIAAYHESGGIGALHREIPVALHTLVNRDPTESATGISDDGELLDLDGQPLTDLGRSLAGRVRRLPPLPGLQRTELDLGEILGMDRGSSRGTGPSAADELERLTNQLERFRRSLDEGYDRAQRLAEANELLAESVAAGLIPQSEATALLDDYGQQLDETADAVTKNTKAIQDSLAVTADYGEIAGRAIERNFAGAAISIRSADDALQLLARTLQDVANEFFRQTVVGPLAGLAGSFVGSLFGGAVGGPKTSAPVGNAGPPTKLIRAGAFAGGGMADSALMHTFAPLADFLDAPHLALGGIPAVLHPGEGVFTPQQMRNADRLLAAANQPPVVNVTVVNESSAEVDAGRGADGNPQVVIRDALRREVGGGALDSVLAGRYGIRPATKR